MLGLGAAAVVFYMYILKPRTTPWSDPTTPTDPGAGIGGGEQHGAQGNSRCKIFQNAAADTKCPSGCCNERGTGQPGWLGSGANQCLAGTKGCYTVTPNVAGVANCHGDSCTNHPEGSVCLQGTPGASDSTYTCQSGTWVATSPLAEIGPNPQSGTCETPGSVYFEPHTQTSRTEKCSPPYANCINAAMDENGVKCACGGFSGIHCSAKCTSEYLKCESDMKTCFALGPKMHACCPTDSNDNRWTYMAGALQDPSAIKQVCCPTISVVNAEFNSGGDPPCTSDLAGNMKFVETWRGGGGMMGPPMRVSEEQFVCNSVGAWHNVTGEALTNNPNGLIFTGCEEGQPP
jgi:hypothetical protein